MNPAYLEQTPSWSHCFSEAYGRQQNPVGNSAGFCLPARRPVAGSGLGLGAAARLVIELELVPRCRVRSRRPRRRPVDILRGRRGFHRGMSPGPEPRLPRMDRQAFRQEPSEGPRLSRRSRACLRPPQETPTARPSGLESSGRRSFRSRRQTKVRQPTGQAFARRPASKRQARSGPVSQVLQSRLRSRRRSSAWTMQMMFQRG